MNIWIPINNNFTQKANKRKVQRIKKIENIIVTDMIILL
jgi:hypothetical protein